MPNYKNNFSNTSALTENIYEENNYSDSNNSKDTSITFTMTALGDSLCHNTQYWDAYNSESEVYDFSYVYNDILDYTQISDLTIGNLETTFAGQEKGYSNYPTFNTPDSLATSLKKLVLIL